MIRLLVPLGVVLVLLCAVRPVVAAVAKDGRGDVRVKGVCGSGATSTLRLKSGDDGIDMRFEVDHSRPGVAWRVVLVHERRIAWKGAVRATRPSGSFEVRRTLQDLPGADAVTARAWGPRGLVCRAAAVLPDS
ncbi:MAG: hypothetical protein ACXW0R_07935 [Gaiellaceae bacterium]